MIKEKNTVQPVNGVEIRKERFEFVLTINDFIVCQRYFKIGGLRPESLHSNELYEALRHCTYLIKRDLKDKTNMYNEITAPRVFKNMEQFNQYVAKHKIDVPEFVIFSENEEVFVWDGSNLKKYDKRFNLLDYISDIDDEKTPNNIKFSFLDNGKVIYSEMWDGNVYPRFVRNNIDLSNSKNRYDDDKPYEAFLLKTLISDRSDLVSPIINEICDVCSMNSREYTSAMEYGNVTYHSNYRNIPLKQMKKYLKNTVVNE